MITSLSSHLLLPLYYRLSSQKTLIFSVTLSDYWGPPLTFSIVKASSGGSTGGGSTGGGSTGGHDGDATVDEPTGPPETDDGGDAGSTIRITSPASGQTFQTGVPLDIAWTTTGAARDMDVCVSLIYPSTSTRPQITLLNSARIGHVLKPGGWTIRAAALFGDDSCPMQADNFCNGGDCPTVDEVNFNVAGHTHSVSGSGGNSECTNLVLSGTRLKVDESAAFEATDVSLIGDCRYPGMSGPKY